MTFVIIAGSIDLSVGSIVGLATVTAASCSGSMGIAAAIPACLVGIVASTVNGVVIAKLAAHRAGLGCTLASAIAANLCLGLAPREACAAATDYVADALRRGYRPGRGDVVVLDHAGASPSPAASPSTSSSKGTP